MLRSFTTDSPFRALAARPFEQGAETCALGRRTVIYGRNGSGKTTFSELLRLAASGRSIDGVAATASIRRGGATNARQLGDRAFPWGIHVFNRYYVQESLELFLDGSGGSPTILKLGAANVAAQQELGDVRSSKIARGQWRESVDVKRRALRTERDAIEKDVKADIIGALSAGDPVKYNSTTFTVTAAKKALRDTSAVELTPTDLQKEIDTANAPILTPVVVPDSWPVLASNLRATINQELLGVHVESEPIERLDSDPVLSDWVERGTPLHQPGDVCGFCQNGTISEEALRVYARHFSAALDELRDRLVKAVDYLSGRRVSHANWLSACPTAEQMLTASRDRFEEELRKVLSQAAHLDAQIDLAIEAVQERLADPLRPLNQDRQLAEDFTEVDASGLLRILDQNNADCESQVVRQKQARTAVEMHYGAASRQPHVLTEERIVMADRAILAIEERERSLGRKAVELEQSQQDTGRMATEIDRDLREHFGHGHLTVSVSDDGKGYVVKRGGQLAKRLSEGERNAIAFAYFLRSLEDDSVDPAESIVVIDDPVSSMDKESLFASFALCEARTEPFAQVVILTHDYEYFRLHMRARERARRRSETKVSEGNPNEIAFPGVSILEMKASMSDAGDSRVSSLRAMPKSLLRHPSEYHYLFLKVAEAVRDGDDETLPLLGNAARRLLEGFISFRAPSGDNFQHKVDQIKRMASIDDVLARRIVKFLHGQSHREEPRPTSALDFPSIEAELRAALDFMRRADPEHFAQMCKAVDVREDTIVAAVVTPTAS